MSAAIAALHPRSTSAFDPGRPPAERTLALVAGLPAPLQQVLAAGRVDRHTRFAEDRFDGLAEVWTPPPAVTQQQAALARQALDSLTASVLAPAPPNHLLARILALLSHYPAKGTTAEVEQMLALDWADDLGEYPAWAIDAAARVWRRTRKWRPSIAEMRALCAEACAGERALAERLRMLADTAHGGTTVHARTRALVAGAIRRMA